MLKQERIELCSGIRYRGLKELARRGPSEWEPDNIDEYSHLIAFALIASRYSWQAAPHLVRLAHLLEGVECGAIKRLLVSVPPRHGKSELVSRLFPAWYLGRHPDREIILCSYGADLAEDLSRDARNIFREIAPELWGLTLAQDARGRSQWAIMDADKRLYPGGMVATGVEGAVVGKGAHVLILDDPIKSIHEARSASVSQHTWDWYRAVARTRLHPDGAIVIVQTRWTKDDLVGRLLSEEAVGGEKWVHLKLPAIEDGKPLWPERYRLEELEEIRRTLGPYLWNAMYQQAPLSDSEGALWNNLLIEQYRSPIPGRIERIVVAIDPAVTADPNSDETGIVVAGRSGDEGYVLDDCSGVYPVEEWAERAVDAYYRYEADVIIAESNQGGDLVRRNISVVDRNVPVRLVHASRGKALRAEPVVSLYRLGKVHHTNVFEELEIQMCAWAGFGHSPDRVDALVYALTDLLIERGPLLKPRVTSVRRI